MPRLYTESSDRHCLANSCETVLQGVFKKSGRRKQVVLRHRSKGRSAALPQTPYLCLLTCSLEGYLLFRFCRSILEPVQVHCLTPPSSLHKGQHPMFGPERSWAKRTATHRGRRVKTDLLMQTPKTSQDSLNCANTLFAFTHVTVTHSPKGSGLSLREVSASQK